MTVAPDNRRSLPMTGITHANRSPVTCHLRCGDACSRPAPNTTETTYFRDIAAKALSRRALLGTGAATAGLAVLAPGIGLARCRLFGGAARRQRPSRLRFTPIDPVAATVDDVTVPSGLLLGPGDPLGRPDPRRGPGLRCREPVVRSAVGPVRLQQRLPRHHARPTPAAPGAAVSQPRVHQRGTSCSRPGTDPETVSARPGPPTACRSSSCRRPPWRPLELRRRARR